MKKAEKTTTSKMPKITIDKSLNKYQGKILFKSTLEKAKEALKKIDLAELAEITQKPV